MLIFPMFFIFVAFVPCLHKRLCLVAWALHFNIWTYALQ